MSDVQRARDHADQKQFQADVINYSEHKHYSIEGEEADKYLVRLFENNFPQLQSKAMAVATKCAEDMAMAVIAGVCEVNPALLENFRRPNVQAALLSAEESFAQTGDPDTNQGDNALGLLLSRLVVKLAVGPKRSLREIALRRAIATAPNLTRQQVNALSVLAVFNTCSFHGENASKLLQSMHNWYEPYYGDIPKSANEYSFMESQGVGASLFGISTFEDIIKKHPRALRKRFGISEIAPNVLQADRETYLEPDPDFPDYLRFREENIQELSLKINSLSAARGRISDHTEQLGSLQTIRDMAGSSVFIHQDELKRMAEEQQPELFKMLTEIDASGAQHFQINIIGYILAKQELDLRFPGNDLLTQVTDLGELSEKDSQP